jgi:hypothetical protein
MSPIGECECWHHQGQPTGSSVDLLTEVADHALGDASFAALTLGVTGIAAGPLHDGGDDLDVIARAVPLGRPQKTLDAVPFAVRGDSSCDLPKSRVRDTAMPRPPTGGGRTGTEGISNLAGLTFRWR